MLLRDLCADFNKLPHGRGECGEISVLCGLVKAGLGHFVKRLPGIEKSGQGEILSCMPRENRKRAAHSEMNRPDSESV